jgi:hydroxymethylpyrimidine/phosphomethylpyrimidine kinase
MSMPRILVVAGSDSGGGAGIQADIKTITALGGYAACAVTALTAQNTEGVAAVLDVPADFIRRQMELVLADIGADAVKTGMLNRADAIVAIAETLELLAPAVPLVVDPVMVAKGGHRLLDEAAHGALIERLLPMARVLTPNIPEAEALTGLVITGADDMAEAGKRLLALGAAAVLVKGGHLAGPRLVDLLVTADGIESFSDSRIDTTSTHGTGCTLASALAEGLARGLDLHEAVVRARAYVRTAIATAPGLGHGHGPLNHGHTIGMDRVLSGWKSGES